MADLITTHEYKDAEGIRGEKEDDRLNILVPQVSDLVKKYCGTSFVDYISTNKVETFFFFYPRQVHSESIIGHFGCFENKSGL